MQKTRGAGGARWLLRTTHLRPYRMPYGLVAR